MNRKKILVVDDDRIILRTLAMKLGAAGYEVITAEEGAAAVNIARQTTPDLILLDINFPPDIFAQGVAWDGFLIIDWLRRIDAAKGIPVIIITAEDATKHLDHARAAGAVGIFHKPIDHAALIETIGRILERSSVQAPDAATTSPASS